MVSDNKVRAVFYCRGLVRVWLYCRVANEGCHFIDVLADQRRHLDAYASEKGWTVVGVSSDVSPGHDIVRPGLEKLKEAVSRRKVDVVLACNADRFFLTHDKLFSFWAYLHDNGAMLHSVAEGQIDMRLYLAIEKALLKSRG